MKSQKIVSPTKCPSPNELPWPDDIGSKQALITCPSLWPRSQVREVFSEICGMEFSSKGVYVCLKKGIWSTRHIKIILICNLTIHSKPDGWQSYFIISFAHYLKEKDLDTSILLPAIITTLRGLFVPKSHTSGPYSLEGFLKIF